MDWMSSSAWRLQMNKSQWISLGVLLALTLFVALYSELDWRNAANLIGYFTLLSMISFWVPMVFLGLIVVFIIGFSIKNRISWWIAVWSCILAPFYVALFFLILGYDLPFA